MIMHSMCTLSGNHSLDESRAGRQMMYGDDQ
jgi:hypothetical protein